MTKKKKNQLIFVASLTLRPTGSQKVFISLFKVKIIFTIYLLLKGKKEKRKAGKGKVGKMNGKKKCGRREGKETKARCPINRYQWRLWNLGRL